MYPPRLRSMKPGNTSQQANSVASKNSSGWTAPPIAPRRRRVRYCLHVGIPYPRGRHNALAGVGERGVLPVQVLAKHRVGQVVLAGQIMAGVGAESCRAGRAMAHAMPRQQPVEERRLQVVAAVELADELDHLVQERAVPAGPVGIAMGPLGTGHHLAVGGGLAVFGVALGKRGVLERRDIRPTAHAVLLARGRELGHQVPPGKQRRVQADLGGVKRLILVNPVQDHQFRAPSP